MLGLIAELIEADDPALAVRLLGTATSIQQDHGVDPTGPIADRIQALAARLRDRLGAEAFELGLNSGRCTSLAETRIDALQAARVAASQRPSAPGQRKRKETVFGGLTARELDVLRLIAGGRSDRQIAEALFTTPKTANHHVSRILAKLECRNRAAATALAFQHGLV